MRQDFWIAGMVFVLLTVCLTTFSMAENPCRQRLFKICQEDEDAMVCRLLSYDEPETVESVSAFLDKIGVLDEGVQKDLICARLMGRKSFMSISTVIDESPSSDGQCDFQSGIGRFIFGISDPAYSKLTKAHHRLEKLKLCPRKSISFDIEGMVEDADAEYSGSRLKSFVLEIEDVKLSNIATPYARGGFEVQRKPLDKKIDAEYQRDFSAGDGKKKKAGKQLKTYSNAIGMEFVLIPAQSSVNNAEKELFDCGAESFESFPKVTKAFYISRYEVTQGQWKTVMGYNPSHFQHCGDTCPVEQVSWNDTQKFIARMNQRGDGTYRLPTEAEWEYAAQAGSSAAYGFGDNESELSQYAWYSKNSERSTHRVGQLKPNNWGLYDMHGNVWEWCEDLYGKASYRVLRGGSWNNPAGYCRSAFRYYNSPGVRGSYYGFRLVRSSGQ